VLAETIQFGPDSSGPAVDVPHGAKVREFQFADLFLKKSPALFTILRHRLDWSLFAAAGVWTPSSSFPQPVPGMADRQADRPLTSDDSGSREHFRSEDRRVECMYHFRLLTREHPSRARPVIDLNPGEFSEYTSIS